MSRTQGYNIDRRGVVRIGRALPIEQAEELMRQKLRGRVRITESGCWEWLGQKITFGYGEVYFRNKRWRTHRLSVWLFKGHFDLSLDVCHTCDNKICCNPDHLWVGTHRENMIDHVVKGRHYEIQKTTCLRGHPLSGDNLELRKLGPDRGYSRRCKICQRGRQRVRSGWPPDLAYSMDVLPFGYRLDRRTRRARKVPPNPNAKENQ